MTNALPVCCLKGHRFPPEIIAYAVRIYLRFSLSLRDVEELLAERGVTVSYEAIRTWVAKFGMQFAAMIRRDRPRPNDKWHLDEVVIQIHGRNHWLWRAVDADGDVLDILVQPRRDAEAAKRFLRKLIRRWGRPRVRRIQPVVATPRRRRLRWLRESDVRIGLDGAPCGSRAGRRRRGARICCGSGGRSRPGARARTLRSASGPRRSWGLAGSGGRAACRHRTCRRSYGRNWVMGRERAAYRGG